MFKIVATDRPTGQPIYGRVNAQGVIAFRTGYHVNGTGNRGLGLHTHPASGDRLTIEEAGRHLQQVVRVLGQTGGSWITNPRIEVA